MSQTNRYHPHCTSEQVMIDFIFNWRFAVGFLTGASLLPIAYVVLVLWIAKQETSR